MDLTINNNFVLQNSDKLLHLIITLSFITNQHLVFILFKLNI